ncbi:helix-turn-helix transcriptional regulator [Halopseudomonas sp.]|uniref:helix-turn-helix transcriptional regulator n=1 Tax=Halopseudomonas sp. TaxID=2901191 RepID=UPI0030022C5A
MLTPRLNIHHYPIAAASHTHADHSQLVFGLHGTLDLEFAGRGACVDSAAVAIIAPGEDHTFLSRDNGRCLVLDVAPHQPLEGLVLGSDQQRRLLESAALRALSPQQSSLVCSLADLISRQPGLATAGASLLLASLLQQPASSGRLPRAALDAYIEAHVAEKITVSDLARVAHCSPSRLRHWFALEFGCSPTDYLRVRRLRLARQLLERGREPVALVAERCGYISQSAFAQAFKHQWGLSPRAARQQAGTRRQ